MRIVILLASCGFALVTFLISLIAYPFIASTFDFNPFALCFIIGIPLLLLTVFVTIIICKERFIRLSIVLPCFMSIALSAIITGVKFDVDNEYRNGYIHPGSLYNGLGFRVVGYHDYFYAGVDEYGYDVIVGANCDEDYDYDDDEYDRYKFKLNYFDTQGNFIDSKELSKRYDENLSLGKVQDEIKEDIKYYAKKYNNITIYAQIG